MKNILFPPLPNERFSIIYVDPPWHYSGKLQHSGTKDKWIGGVNKHYPTIKLNDLMRLNVPSITADDCLLFMWTSSPHLDQAIKLGEAWKFKTFYHRFHMGQTNT